MNLPADLLQIAHLIHLCDEDARTSCHLPAALREELTSLSERTSALAKTIAAAIAQSRRFETRPFETRPDVRSSNSEDLRPDGVCDDKR